MRVARDSSRVENHSAVLNRAVRIREPCTNHCHSRLHHAAYHFTQPLIVDHFHVIVEQRDERT